MIEWIWLAVSKENWIAAGEYWLDKAGLQLASLNRVKQAWGEKDMLGHSWWLILVQNWLTVFEWNGGDGDGDGSDNGAGDGGNGNGGEDDDWKNRVDRMHALWNICFVPSIDIIHGNTPLALP